MTSTTKNDCSDPISRRHICLRTNRNSMTFILKGKERALTCSSRRCVDLKADIHYANLDSAEQHGWTFEVGEEIKKRFPDHKLHPDCEIICTFCPECSQHLNLSHRKWGD